MTTIVTRSGKGSSLSWSEVDANFTNLNTDKIETSALGVTVQEFSANLNTFSTVAPTAAGLALLDDADATVQRNTLGLNNVDNTSDATKNAASVTLTNKTIAAATNTVEALSGPNTSPLSNRNVVINGGFNVNQRSYVSGAAVGANLYGHDRWKMAASGDTYTFSTTANKTTVTIPASKVLQQVIEGVNLVTDTYTLSWEGTAQGKIGAGSYGSSGITSSITGGTNTTIEFGPGTVTNVQLERGSKSTPFEVRNVGLEVSLCQRYCEVVVACVAGYANAASAQMASPLVFVTKRATPTASLVSNTVLVNTSSVSIDQLSAFGGRFVVTATASGIASVFSTYLISSEL